MGTRAFYVLQMVSVQDPIKSSIISIIGFFLFLLGFKIGAEADGIIFFVCTSYLGL